MIEFQKVGDFGYYLTPEFEGEQVNIRWGGKARELLGLPEEFDPVMFERVLNGRNPHDGSKLTARWSSNRRNGWDITVTDEKVSSVLELLAGDDRILQLKRDANDYAMNRVEKLVGARVRKGGANDDRITGNALWATVEHETNRDGMVHRHHHNVLCNMTYDKHKGERIWKAVELDQREAKQIQRAHTKFIVKGLRQLGYKVKTHGRRYDVVGVPEEVIEQHSTGSKRVKETRQQFDSEAEKRGHPKMSRKAAAKLPLYDRPEKVGNGTREDMHRDWRSKLTDYEGLRAVHRKARGKSRRGGWPDEARVAFDRIQGYSRENHAERSVGRSR